MNSFKILKIFFKIFMIFFRKFLNFLIFRFLMDATEEMIRRSEEAARVAELTEQVQSHLPISAYLHFIYILID